jgi:hypothetical protein
MSIANDVGNVPHNCNRAGMVSTNTSLGNLLFSKLLLCGLRLMEECPDGEHRTMSKAVPVYTGLYVRAPRAMVSRSHH